MVLAKPTCSLTGRHVAIGILSEEVIVVDGVVSPCRDDVCSLKAVKEVVVTSTGEVSVITTGTELVKYGLEEVGGTAEEEMKDV